MIALMRSIGIIGNGQTVSAEVLFRAECAVQIVRAVRHMDAILVQGEFPVGEYVFY